MQRAYDQVLHDVARQDQHVIFGIDRAGLVGGDGETHQGIYDISYLRHIPNMEIVQPKDATEAWQLMDYAFHVTKHPIAIRYSRNKIEKSQLPLKSTDQIVRPSWTIIREGTVAIVIAYGDNINRLDLLLAQSPHDVRLINARFIKPLDEAMLESLLADRLPIMVVEDVVAISGLGSAILEYCASHLVRIPPISIQGLPDQFIEQGDNADIYQKYHLDDNSLMKTLAELIENHH
jgi:1-deoxy-D-xylulose-5-phosphate synthase